MCCGAQLFSNLLSLSNFYRFCALFVYALYAASDAMPVGVLGCSWVFCFMFCVLLHVLGASAPPRPVSFSLPSRGERVGTVLSVSLSSFRWVVGWLGRLSSGPSPFTLRELVLHREHPSTHAMTSLLSSSLSLSPLLFCACYSTLVAFLFLSHLVSLPVSSFSRFLPVSTGALVL